jgi:hypothetical protein
VTPYENNRREQMRRSGAAHLVAAGRLSTSSRRIDRSDRSRAAMRLEALSL